MVTSTKNAANVWGEALDNSGLHHLADAATALTQLTDTVPALSESKRARAHTVSDDDERSSVGEIHTNLHSGNILPTSSKYITENTNLDGSKQIFPQRFMRLLNEPSISEVITWLPHGQSFIIFKPTVFTEKILPAYFPESCVEKKSFKANSSACKYPSFTRKLNRWGFRQVSRGTDAGAFHHKLFQRSNPDACLQMVCQRSRRRKNDKKADDDTSTGSDAGSIDTSVALKSSTNTGPSLSNNKRKSCGPNGAPVTDSESDTSSTLQNKVKSLPPKKRKHCVKRDSSGDDAHTYRSVTPPRPHYSSEPNLPCPTSNICSLGSDSSVQLVSQISKGRVNPTAQISTPSLLQPPAKTYLNARALLQHNVALNNIHTLNTAVAMAQVHTQQASLRNIPTILDNLVKLANNTSTQEAPSTTHIPTSSPIKSSNNMALLSVKPHTQLPNSSDDSKENEAQERAINAKKMLYSAFLEALK